MGRAGWHAYGYWLKRFCKRFGLVKGTLAAASFARIARARSSQPAAIRVPGWKEPLWLRPLSTDANVYFQLVIDGELGFPFASEPRRIVDGGANIGIGSRIFSQRWPNADIIAVELDPGNFSMLKRNCAGVPRITAEQGAIWDRDGWVDVMDPGGGEWAYRAVDSAVGQVPAFTVNALLDRVRWNSVDLLKLDIEGAEERVLRNASTWLPRVHTLVIELHENLVPGCQDAFDAAVSGQPFDISRHGEYLVVSRRS
jgi:FkbM family methyltransferase